VIRWHFEEALGGILRNAGGVGGNGGNEPGTASAEKIAGALLEKKRKYRLNYGDGREGLVRTIARFVSSGSPIPIRVAWGYGKDPYFKEFRGETWYAPDIAEVATLAVLSSALAGVSYPVQATITLSGERYLKANYSAIGIEPEAWVKEGIEEYARQFRELASRLLPGVGVTGVYDLAEGINFDAERGSTEIVAALRRYKTESRERYDGLVGHVRRHSEDPEASADFYLAEKLVEEKHGVGNGGVTIQFTSSQRSIQYHTTPRELHGMPEIIPPWEAIGGVVTGTGESWSVRMLSPKRLSDPSTSGPSWVETFTINGHEVEGWVYGA
jgi:hypothetical protein